MTYNHFDLYPLSKFNIGPSSCGKEHVLRDHLWSWGLDSPGYRKWQEQTNNAKRDDYLIPMFAPVSKALLQPPHGPRHYKTDIVGRDYEFQCSLLCVSTFLSVYVEIKQHAQGYKNSLEVIDMLIMLNQVNNARVTSS